MPKQWDKDYHDDELTPKMIKDLEDKERLEAQAYMEEQKKQDAEVKKMQTGQPQNKNDKPAVGSEQHKILSAANPKYHVPTEGSFKVPYGMKKIENKEDLASLMETDPSNLEMIE